MISRRTLLSTGATLTGVGLLTSSWIGAALAQQVSQAATTDAEQLLQLSLFLTERESLDASLAQRVLTRCTEADPAFADKMKSLWGQIQQQGLSHAGLLRSSPIYQDPVHKDTVQKDRPCLVPGLHRHPCQPKSGRRHRAGDIHWCVGLYADAGCHCDSDLFAGHTNYWVNPPSTVAND